jgi:hypothetical protein
MLNRLMAGLTFLAQVLVFVGAPAVRAESAPIISAVQITEGVGFTNNDFIELYNPSSEPFNLNGFRLVKRSSAGITDSSIKSWTEDTFIPAYSFYLWANNTYIGINPSADFVSSSTLANDNGVALRQGAADTGVIVASAAWGATSNTFTSVGPNPGAGESLALEDPLDPAKGYKIRQSLPRNSTVKLEPQDLPDDPPIVVDNAACATPPQTVNTGPGVTTDMSIEFTNTGTSSWNAENYKILDVASGVDLAFVGSVAPAGSIESAISLVSPQLGGLYSYSWQMRHEDENFGTACTLSLTVSDPEPPAQPQIRINEFLPNPTGEDSGLEKIELYNYGPSSADLTGWILDDIASGDPLSTNALTLDIAVLPAGSYLVVTIPAGKFSLNNTAGEVVSLFNKDKQYVDTASFTGSAAENKSYSYFSSGWQWTSSTFGAINIEPITDPDEEPEDEEGEEPIGPAQISINEIYPFPSAEQNEFLELYNDGDEVLQLKNITLWVGERSRALPDVLLAPGEYFVVEGKVLPAALRNTGQTIRLFSSDEQTDIVQYPKASKGRSYSKFEDSFLWTIKATPGKPNQMEDPETSGLVVSGVADKQDPPVTQAANKSTVIKPKTAAAITAQGITLEEPEALSSETSAPAPTKNKWSLPALIAVGACTLAGGMWVSYRYAFRGQPDFV